MSLTGGGTGPVVEAGASEPGAFAGAWPEAPGAAPAGDLSSGAVSDPAGFGFAPGRAA
jgi:hypothetical protein